MAQLRLITKSIVVRCGMMWNFVKGIPRWLARTLLALTGWEAQESAMYRGTSSTRNIDQANGTARAYSIHQIIICLIGIAGFQPVILVFAAERCVAPEATRVVSVQGHVTLSMIGTAALQPAKLNDLLCVGDTVRVGAKSRAVLRLPNETTIPLDQNTVFQLKQPISEKEPTLIELIQGAIHVITRTPKPFKVNTPYMNAAVEGTEFFVGVDSQEARVAVIEGKVNVSNELGALLLTDNEAAIAKKGQAPQKTLTIKPRDAVQWALYYPPLFDPRVRPGAESLSASYEFYSQGKIPEAIESLNAILDGERNGDYYTYRAGLLLLVGRADEAEPDIETALKENANNTDALSLKAIIAIVQNDKVKALELANQAVSIDDKSAPARIALSYALQANFKIEEALKAAREATARDANNALAWARVAELELSIPNYDKSKEAAEQAVKLNPNLARTQTILGFANLTRIDIKAAKENFNKAIELDQADPLPRLGNGLAKIREGDLAKGREEIEIAAALDPENSLVRSYLGKAYYEEKRETEAGTQFELAKEWDAKDPTPYFYAAIKKQSENRPVEALNKLNKSIELNDNRAVYRSRLALDEDLAARNSSLARLYTNFGLQKLALLEATKSLVQDPINYSAHRFLADAYAGQSRLDIARASELLQSQLRQRISAVPALFDLSVDRSSESTVRVGGLGDTGFGQGGLNEFSSLFDREGFSLHGQGLVGNTGTIADKLTFTGNHQKVSYAIGQFHYETDGFGDNSDIRKDQYNLALNAALSSQSTVQFEYRQLEFRRGEVESPFDSDFRVRTRVHEDINNFRIGFNHSISPRAGVIVSGIRQTRKLFTDIPDFGVTRTFDTNALIGEAQLYYNLPRMTLQTGVGYFRGKEHFLEGDTTAKPSHNNFYAYGSINLRTDLTYVIGLSVDNIKSETFHRRVTNPKLGIVWNPHESTTIRIASFRGLKRRLIANQTIEPSQVAGFNQLFDDLNGVLVRRSGVALDQRIGQHVFLGLEVSKRDLKVPFLSSSGFEDINWEEKSVSSYLYWIVPRKAISAIASNWDLSLRSELLYESFRRPDTLTGPEGILDLKTYRLPLGLTLSNYGRLIITLINTYVDQSGALSVTPGANVFPIRKRFWVTDTAVSFQLRRRLGFLEFGAKNIFDRRFQYQDIDSVNPTFALQRFFYARLSLVLK